MPRRKDINKVLVIGSGPIVIGQAAEFDYAGTQACLALKEEGCEVVLCNSNPATIMTDTSIADKVYMEPLTLEYIARIIRKERPDAILPGIGGQTGLNLAVQLEKKGILAECRTELLGTRSSSIEKAEDRKLFKELCESLGEPVLPSEIADSMERGLLAAQEIGFPVVLRPAFTLGGTGGGFAESEEEFRMLMKNALELSPVHQVLIEKSVKGYKEIEYEVMRDKNDTAITVCNMENIDPVGIHTGDSIVVCPSQTLTNKEYHMLRDSALKVIRALEIEGGCNVQFALDPRSFQYYLIEVNPRVSRSSALASKASGYPIARVSAKIGIGYTLDEIMLANTPAAFEPSLDYVVTKMPRFPFDKYPKMPDGIFGYSQAGSPPADPVGESACANSPRGPVAPSRSGSAADKYPKMPDGILGYSQAGSPPADPIGESACANSPRGPVAPSRSGSAADKYPNKMPDGILGYSQAGNPPADPIGESAIAPGNAGPDILLLEEARQLAGESGDVLSTQMKATGEVMSVGRTLEESLLKAVRSLETGHLHLYADKFDEIEEEVLLDYIHEGREDRIFAIAELFRRQIRKEGTFSSDESVSCGTETFSSEGSLTFRTGTSSSDKSASCRTGTSSSEGSLSFRTGTSSSDKNASCRTGTSSSDKSASCRTGEYPDFSPGDSHFCGILAPMVERIYRKTGIDPIYLRKIRNIVLEEARLRACPGDCEALWEAKRMGFSDAAVAKFWDMTEEQVFALRQAEGIVPVYKMIDTCASEFDSYVPYFYSTYEEENEAFPPKEVFCKEEDVFAADTKAAGRPEFHGKASRRGTRAYTRKKRKIVVLGSGPIRIGQGVEFDYSTVHAVQTIRDAGFEAIIINNNPETVSTDYTCSDKLYFEPLCVEDVMNVVAMEKPEGVIATLGGQTAINLAEPLAARGVRIIGTGREAIERAENRDAFEKLLEELKIPQPKGHAVTSIEAGVRAAREIGYPVLVRPSFVLGGRAMQIVGKEEELREYLARAFDMEKHARLQGTDAGKETGEQKTETGRNSEEQRIETGRNSEEQGVETGRNSEEQGVETGRNSEEQGVETGRNTDEQGTETGRNTDEQGTETGRILNKKSAAAEEDHAAEEGVKPVLVDKYIRGKEVEVDAVCDGEQVFVPGIMELVERTGVHSGDSISVYPPYSLSGQVKRTILEYAYKLGIGIGIRGLFNIQFIVDENEKVYIIEVNPRSSRTVPFLSKATGCSLADIATLVGLGISLREQGITAAPAENRSISLEEQKTAGDAAEETLAAEEDIVKKSAAEEDTAEKGIPETMTAESTAPVTAVYPKEKERYYVKVPAFSFSKLRGMDAYLSPEMKSTGEAIGYDKKLHRAMYKAMIASGIRLKSYGTVVVSVADEDKLETIPLIRRFYEMGFNIEASSLTGEYLRAAGIRTRIRLKPSEGSEEILDSIRAGYVSYVINTRAVLSGVHYGDGVRIRSCASLNNVPMLTSLDTVRMLLDVLEEMTMGISTIDGA